MISFKYLRDNFPENKEQADEIWQQICSSLAPENLHEDGEIPSNWADRKFEDIHHDAKLLAKAWPCPKHIADRCDDDISMYVRRDRDRHQEKDVEENCECGIAENNTWDEEVFDRFGCDCENGNKENV